MSSIQCFCQINVTNAHITFKHILHISEDIGIFCWFSIIMNFSLKFVVFPVPLVFFYHHSRSINCATQSKIKSWPNELKKSQFLTLVLNKNFRVTVNSFPYVYYHKKLFHFHIKIHISYPILIKKIFLKAAAGLTDQKSLT